MSKTINKATQMGTITRDIELKFLPNGNAIANFSIAVNKRYKTQSGETKDEVSYFNQVAFGKTAENINKYFQKGSRIIVVSEPKEERWEKEGQKNSRIVFMVEEFYFVDKSENQSKPKHENKLLTNEFEIDESEIPF